MALLLSTPSSVTSITVASINNPLRTLPFLSTKTLNLPSISNTRRRRRRGRGTILSPLRVAAPPTAPSTSGQEDQSDQDTSQSDHDRPIEVDDDDDDESSSSKFSWRDHWYPVSLIEDLDPRIPTPFQLLGRDIVLWKDRATGEWVTFDDKCPHRLAPLSEGRIDEDGNLQCSYHGWSFDRCGSCTRIPQASSEGPEARALQSPRACVTRFPTMVSQGLLFVWPDEDGWERAQVTKPPM